MDEGIRASQVGIFPGTLGAIGVTVNVKQRSKTEEYFFTRNRGRYVARKIHVGCRNMVGLDIGTTKISLSDGSTIKLPSDQSPHDLLARVADETPYVRVSSAGIELIPACDIFATAVAHAIFDRQLMGEADVPVAVSVPGWWSTRVLTRVRGALTRQGVSAVLINEAEGALAAFQADHGGSDQQLSEYVAVVSMCAEATSVVIVHNTADDPRVLAHPVSARTEGSRSVDTAVLQHLVRGLQDLGDEIAVTDLATIRAARAALPQCRTLKESLSTIGTEALQPSIPKAQHRIRVVRSELEELATPWVNAIVDMLKTTIEQCAERVDSVLLIGGPATMPLISQRVSADLGLTVVVPDDPKTTAVRGAAQLLAERRDAPRKKRSMWASLKQQFSGTAGESTHRDSVPASPQFRPHITTSAASAWNGGTDVPLDRPAFTEPGFDPAEQLVRP